MKDEMEFDLKEFTRWWESYKKNEPELDKRIEAALMKTKAIVLQTSR